MLNISETRVPAPPDPLTALAEKWEQAARRKIATAKQTNDIPAQRPTPEALIQHGAICYFNCAQELRRVLNGQATDRPLPVLEDTSAKTINATSI